VKGESARGRRPRPERGLRLLIVEDHPIVRRGLKDILEEAFPRATFGEADDSQGAARELQRGEWDAMLLDINIPGRSGLELLEDVRREWPKIRVLVVSAYPEEEFAVRAFRLGAAGYLGKTQASEELVAALRKILAGGRYVPTSLAERLAAALEEGDANREPHEALSARELQVLRLVAAGRSLKAIAAELALSEKTVSTYRARIAAKTGLATNVDLTRYAFQHGLTE
jgi:DNA-binding NarL/FixJ family response regulator